MYMENKIPGFVAIRFVIDSNEDGRITYSYTIPTENGWSNVGGHAKVGEPIDILKSELTGD